MTGQQIRFQKWFIGLVAVAIALVILVQGRFVLVPLAIAILLFSLMGAAIDRIARLRLGPVRVPVWVASVVAVLLVAVAMFSILAVLYGQIDALIVAGPQYVDRGEQFVAMLFAWLGEDVAAGVLAAFDDIDLAAYVRALAGSAGYILATTIMITLYVGFLFAERRRFPRKMLRLFPDAQRARRFGHVYRSITRSVHRYILIKTVVSVFTGLLVYVVMRLFRLDFAETWGMLAVFLNFIPNIGSIVATALPTLVAMAQFDTWTSVLAIFVVLGTIQFAIGNVIEPLLMGRSLHLSSFVIILSLTFWGAIWGVMGMLLAVPIMVMVMIVCSHVPALHPVAVLLSRDGSPTVWQEAEAGRSGREGPAA